MNNLQGECVRQRGATLIGGLLMLAVGGILAYGLIRLVPIGMEYLAVSRAMAALTEGAATGTSASEIRAVLARRFEIDGVHSVTAQEADIESEGGGIRVRLVYDGRVSFIDPVQLVLHFDKSVMVGVGAGP